MKTELGTSAGVAELTSIVQQLFGCLAPCSQCTCTYGTKSGVYKSIFCSASYEMFLAVSSNDCHSLITLVEM